MEHSTWTSQLRKGAVEAAVLGVLFEQGACYGLQILDAFTSHGMALTEGALYPLLNRLEKSGTIAANWRLDDGAPRPRKYYELTPQGEQLLLDVRQVWPAFRDQMDSLIMTGGKGA